MLIKYKIRFPCARILMSTSISSLGITAPAATTKIRNSAPWLLVVRAFSKCRLICNRWMNSWNEWRQCDTTWHPDTEHNLTYWINVNFGGDQFIRYSCFFPDRRNWNYFSAFCTTDLLFIVLLNLKLIYFCFFFSFTFQAEKDGPCGKYRLLGLLWCGRLIFVLGIFRIDLCMLDQSRHLWGWEPWWVSALYITLWWTADPNHEFPSNRIWFVFFFLLLRRIEKLVSWMAHGVRIDRLVRSGQIDHNEKQQHWVYKFILCAILARTWHIATMQLV